MPALSRLAAVSLTFTAAAGLVAPSTSAQAAAPQAASAAPSYGTWGFDLAGRDLSVKPGDDFEGYASGSYLKTAKIPADQSRWGSFNILRDLSDTRVRGILDEMAAGAEAAKIGRAHV